jgi:hypothetical protein
MYVNFIFLIPWSTISILHFWGAWKHLKDLMSRWK